MSECNVRIFDYYNSQQIRIYNKTLTYDDKKFFENKHNKNKSNEDKKILSERSSSNRTKQTVYEIVRANRWDWFITLTFNRDIIDSSDYDLLIKKVGKWLNNLKRVAPDLKYILVPELHSDGLHYHFHGLFANTGGIDFVNSGHKKGGHFIYNIKNFKYGFSTATKVIDTNRAGSYIAKYITKDLEKHLKNKRRFLASKNCVRADVSSFSLTENEKLQLLASVSDNITFMKTQDISFSHTQISYIEVSKS